MIQVVVPHNLPPDRKIIAATPDGQRIQIVVPANMQAGQKMQVKIPAPSAAAQQQMNVQIPAGVAPGQRLRVKTPDGKLIEVVVPQGMRAGQTMTVNVQSAAEHAAANRMQALHRGNSGRLSAKQNVVPSSLAGMCAILRRELGLSGNLSEVIETAAMQLGIDTSGATLAASASKCMGVLGYTDAAAAQTRASSLPASTSSVGQFSSGHSSLYSEASDNGIGAARQHLSPGSDEYRQAEYDFSKSLDASQKSRLRLVSIEKLNNPYLKMMYDTQLSMLKMREANRKQAGKPSLEPHELEYSWCFHSTNAEAVENIIANGLNRSYGGKNAMYYGVGVYFARDASYSARDTYSPPDANGHKRVFLCRLARGSHVAVRHGYGDKAHEKEAPVRDPDRLLGVGTLKHDTTTNGQMKDGQPEVMVAMKDGQGYPEYLVTFSI